MMFAFSSHLLQLCFSFCYKLYFRTVFVLQNSCTGRTESLYLPTHFFLLLTFYIYYEICHIKSPKLINHYWLKCIVYSDFLSFLPNAFFFFLVPGSHLKTWHLIIMASTWLWEFLILSLLTVTVWGIPFRYLVQCPHI